MTWLTWRQSRTELIIGGAVLGLIFVFLVWFGLALRSNYADWRIADCLTFKLSEATCQGPLSKFSGRIDFIKGLTVWLQMLSLLIGVLLAAPIVFDLEQGTSRLVWTQSVTRRRWLLVRTGIALAIAAAASLLLMLVGTWLYRPFSHFANQYDTQVFGFKGIVIVSYTVFAFALFLAAGSVLRRIAPAFGITLVGFVATRVFFGEYLRSHYLAPRKAIEATTARQSVENQDGWWWLSGGPSDKFGHLKDANDPVVQACYSAFDSLGPSETRADVEAARSAVDQCFHDHEIYLTTIYHPASRFWIFQGIESAIFLGLSAILLGLTFYWVTRRIAR